MKFKNFLFESDSNEEIKVKAFLALGQQQRGYPEHTMLKIQKYLGGGVLSFVVEHAGDLIQRMSHMADWNNYGQEYVFDKCEKVLRTLKHRYGFEKEHEENLKSNAKFRNIDEDVFRKNVDLLLEEYAKEHSKLPVYNKPQWLAREACFYIGKQKWRNAIVYLEILYDIVKDEKRWEKEASYAEIKNGKIVEYKN